MKRFSLMKQTHHGDQPPPVAMAAVAPRRAAFLEVDYYPGVRPVSAEAAGATRRFQSFRN